MHLKQFITYSFRQFITSLCNSYRQFCTLPKYTYKFTVIIVHIALVSFKQTKERNKLYITLVYVEWIENCSCIL